ncbi:SHOCT domain-containing protein [Micromonospora echinofusca]|uniref:SHOCT domain-containing protein n=2 Tax=Micromonospora echinofusca TaxID=47858 RepID=A0ABS3VNY6_MICEH|nr:SHOCT domain-containing protein [Micromonospora echinofusca]
MTVMMLGWLVLLLLVIGAALFAATHYRRGAADTQDTARRILAERYARGEIDADEYQRRRAALS